jgi:GT2 family glycosyltransferase
MPSQRVSSVIEVVSATRLAPREFATRSALGRSLQRLAFDTRLGAALAFENRAGLPTVFNARIGAAEAPEILVFMHDDVWIDDHYFADRIVDGLRSFDVIGVAGNRRRVVRQPAWCFIDDRWTPDDPAHLSGAVAHGPLAGGTVSYYGPAPAECELLDGVLLAARKSVLQAGNVAFDPRFDFHFYDLDFCRAARQAGLRLGTWPIAITHQSGGQVGSTSWRRNYATYLAKWGG